MDAACCSELITRRGALQATILQVAPQRREERVESCPECTSSPHLPNLPHDSGLRHRRPPSAHLRAQRHGSAPHSSTPCCAGGTPCFPAPYRFARCPPPAVSPTCVLQAAPWLTRHSSDCKQVEYLPMTGLMHMLAHLAAFTMSTSIIALLAIH